MHVENVIMLQVQLAMRIMELAVIKLVACRGMKETTATKLCANKTAVPESVLLPMYVVPVEISTWFHQTVKISVSKVFSDL